MNPWTIGPNSESARRAASCRRLGALSTPLRPPWKVVGMEASQNAELISLGIAENGPCLLALSNVYPTGSECDQPIHLFVEPSIDGTDVHVQAILQGLRLRNPHKDEGWRTRKLADRVVTLEALSGPPP